MAVLNTIRSAVGSTCTARVDAGLRAHINKLYSHATKKDLSGMGTFLMIGVVGLIVAMIINLFLQSPAMMFAISAIGVLVVAGLTAFHTQKIKNIYVAYSAPGDQEWLDEDGQTPLHLAVICGDNPDLVRTLINVNAGAGGGGTQLHGAAVSDANLAVVREPREIALLEALDAAEARIDPAMRARDFAAAMSALAALRGPIDAFFAEVQVNADDAAVRRNRLGLLGLVRALCLSVADLSKIRG